MANKADIQFQAPKIPRSQNLGHKSKYVSYKNLSKFGYLYLAFMADKGQHLVLNLRNTYLEEVKIWGQYMTTRVLLKKFYLDYLDLEPIKVKELRLGHEHI